MLFFSVLATLAAVTVHVNAATGPLCYNCQHSLDPKQCDSTIRCQADEECFGKKVMSSAGAIVYSVGCEKRSLCDAFGNNPAIGRKRNTRSEKRDAEMCFRCCANDRCNNALCMEHEGGGNNPQQGATHPLYVRLLDGPDAYEGRVEVFYNDEWGTICDDHWSGADAAVICKMLGFSAAGAGGIGRAAYGIGTTHRIWLDEVNCTGSETSIMSCPNNGWGLHDCGALEDAGVLCTPVGSADNIIWLLDTGNGGAIIRMDLNSNSYTVLPKNPVYTPAAIDYDAKYGRIYFTDIRLHQIVSVHYDGYDARELVQLSTTSQLEKLEVDSESQMLFYTDTGSNAIGTIKLDGTGFKQIITTNLDEPRDIVVDPQSQVVYWTDWGTSPKIESCKYDGTNRQTLVNSGLKWPNGLGIDHDYGRLYFADAGTHKIEAVDFNGQNRKEIFQDSGAHFFALSVYTDFLYYTDWNRRSLMRVNKDGSGNIKVGPSSFTQLSDLRIHKYGVGPSAVSTPKPVVYERDHVFVRLVGKGNTNEGRVEVYANGEWGTICDDHWSNNDASVICGMLGYDRRGAVAYGNATHGSGNDLLIYLDEVTCTGTEESIVDCQIGTWGAHDCSHSEDASVVCQEKTTPDNFLIAVDSRIGELYRFDLKTLSYTALPQLSVYNPVAVAYDHVHKKIYYTDVRLGVIRRTDMDGNHEQNFRVLSRGSVPDGIAIDSQAQLLFYTDTGHNLIKSIGLDGTNERTIISSQLDEPRGIALDTNNRIVYWTDWGRSPKIEKSSYDGSNRVAIVTQNIALPNGIAFDAKEGKVYFCDAGTKRIEVVNTDGTGRKTLFEDSGSHFFGIAVDSYYIYYTDWVKIGVMRMKKDGTGEMMAGPPDFPRLDGITLYHSGQ